MWLDIIATIHKRPTNTLHTRTSQSLYIMVRKQLDSDDDNAQLVHISIMVQFTKWINCGHGLQSWIALD